MAIYVNGGNKGGGNNPFGSLIGLLMLGGVIAVIYMILKGLFAYAFYITPIFVILTLLIDHRIILKYFADLGASFRKDVIIGALKAAFAIFTPFVAMWLFLKALLYRKVSRVAKGLDDHMKGFQDDLDKHSTKRDKKGNNNKNKGVDDDGYAEYEEIK
jgi:hypothetical protein